MCASGLVGSTSWSCRSNTAFGKPFKRLATSGFRNYKRDVRDYYETWPTYESDNLLHPQQALKLVNFVPLKRGDSVLDIATGTGFVAFQAARKVGRIGAVHGVDISWRMLLQAQAKWEGVQEDIADCTFIEADIEQLNFARASFDCILCSAALPYLSDLPALFRKARRWLRRGGWLAFNTPQEPYPPTEPLLFSVYKKFGIPAINSGLEIGSENRVRRMLEAAGFMDIQVEIEKGTPAFEQVDDAKTYAEEVWQFMEWTPLVDFSAVEDATVNDAYETFVTSAAQLIERKLDADRTLKTTLSTIWVLAR